MLHVSRRDGQPESLQGCGLFHEKSQFQIVTSFVALEKSLSVSITRSIQSSVNLFYTALPSGMFQS